MWLVASELKPESPNPNLLPWVDVGLAALQMVVQVVAEEMDQIYRVVPGSLVGVAGEEDKGDVAHSLPRSCVWVLHKENTPQNEHQNLNFVKDKHS